MSVKWRKKEEMEVGQHFRQVLNLDPKIGILGQVRGPKVRGTTKVGVMETFQA